MAVVAMIAVRVLVPSRQPIELDIAARQTDAHVAIASLAHYLHLVVVDAARRRYGKVGAHAGGVLVRLALALVGDAQVAVGERQRLPLVLSAPGARQRRLLVVDVRIEARYDVAHEHRRDVRRGGRGRREVVAARRAARVHLLAL